MAHPNSELIESFYAAFAAKDGEKMTRLYSNDVVFSDPVFPNLVGERAKGMWKMLTSPGRDSKLRIEASNITADDTSGTAHWEAHYVFGPQKRPVHNIIDARFELKDGLIIRHTDTFDFWRWSRQALGLPGVLLGWSPMIKNKVRATAAKSLDAYLSK